MGEVVRQFGQNARIDCASDVTRQCGATAAPRDSAECASGLAGPDGSGLADQSVSPGSDRMSRCGPAVNFMRSSDCFLLACAANEER